MNKNRQEYLWVAIFLLCLLSIFLWKPLFHNYVLVAGDLPSYYDPLWKSSTHTNAQPSPANNLLGDQINYFYPWNHFINQQIKSGHIPLWNPYSGAGTPFMADSASAVFDPIRFLLFMFIPFNKVLVLQAFFRLFIAGIFTYVYTRKIGLSPFGGLVSMIAFTFSGFMITWLGYQLTAVACWLPLLLWLIEKWLTTNNKKYLIFIAFIFGIQCFGGHIPTSLHLVTVVTVYFIYRWFTLRKDKQFPSKWIQWFSFGLAGMAGILLAAIQIIPFIEFLHYSSVVHGRGAPYPRLFDIQILTGNSTVLKGVYPTLLTGLFPDILGNPILNNYGYSLSSWFMNYNEQNIYVGLFPFFSALFVVLYFLMMVYSKKQISSPFRPFLIFYISLLIISLGIILKAPLFNLFNHLPILSMASFGRFRLFYTFSGAVLAGYGMDICLDVIERESASKNVNKLIKICIGFLILTLVIYLLYWLRPRILPAHRYLHMEALIQPTFWGVLSVIILWLYSQNRISQTFFKILVIGLITSDLFYFGINYNPYIRPHQIYPLVDPLKFVKERVTHERMMGLEDIEMAASPMVHQFYDIRASNPMRTYWYDETMTKMFHGDFHYYINFAVSNPEKEMLNFFGIKYILSYKELDPNLDYLKPVYYNNPIFVYENLTVLPRAFLAGSISEKLADDPLPNLDISIGDEPVQFGKPFIPFVSNLGVLKSGRTKILEYAPEKVVIQSESTTDSYLILSDTWYPGWKAMIDGVPAQIYCANQAFRAVRVTAGSHKIVFNYSPVSFTIGAILSGLTFLVLVLLLIYFQWRERKDVLKLINNSTT